MALEKTSENKVFDGWHTQFIHESKSLNCKMRFAVYLPPGIGPDNKMPVLYWLSGLTCTDENFMQKAGAFKMAAKLGIVIVAPDTSPRGEGIADDSAYDLGQGAGFYVNATQQPWAEHFQMYDYIVNELPQLVEEHFPVNQKRSITGHSMGGHGALTIGLKNSSRYQSISAFSPICNPVECDWGKKAFMAYLGDDNARWREHDATELLNGLDTHLPIKIDQGLADNFYPHQLLTSNFEAVLKAKGQTFTVDYREGYDHSYYFISSFIDEHLEYHAKYLC